MRLEMPKTSAADLIKKGRLQVGWVSCAVKEHVRVLWCFNCLDYGHRTAKQKTAREPFDKVRR